MILSATVVVVRRIRIVCEILIKQVGEVFCRVDKHHLACTRFDDIKHIHTAAGPVRVIKTLPLSESSRITTGLLGGAPLPFFTVSVSFPLLITVKEVAAIVIPAWIQCDVNVVIVRNGYPCFHNQVYHSSLCHGEICREDKLERLVSTLDHLI